MSKEHKHVDEIRIEIKKSSQNHPYEENPGISFFQSHAAQMHKNTCKHKRASASQLKGPQNICLFECSCIEYWYMNHFI